MIQSALLGVLAQAQSVAVLTGSGISVASGIPTYRGDDPNSRWNAYDPNQMATKQGFDLEPAATFARYEQWRQQIEAAQPNSAHIALAQLEGLYPQFEVFTQNIDSLHQRAGSKHVSEMHGNLRRIICSVERNIVDYQADQPPFCPQCGAPLRHDIVWFGELLDAGLLANAKRAFDTSDVSLIIGTSSIVEPVASLPHRALRRGKTVIEINPDAPLRGIASFSLAERADVALPLLLAELK